MKKLLMIALSAFTLTMSACTNNKTEEIKVVSTLYPQYDFVEQMAGEFINHTYILPFGASAHTFEPTPVMVATILDADIVFYTSDELEPWIVDLKANDASDAVFVDLSEGISLHEGEEELDLDEHDHEVDPHYWVNPLNAQVMVDHIYDRFQNIGFDESTLSAITSGYQMLTNDLTELDLLNRDLVAHAKVDYIMHGGHNAFGYFAEEYGIEYITPYDGFSTNAEPTPQALMELTNIMKEYDVHVIYAEEYVAPIVAETIAAETDAIVLQLSTGGSISEEAFDAGVHFIDMMKENIEKLKVGMKYE